MSKEMVPGMALVGPCARGREMSLTKENMAKAEEHRALQRKTALVEIEQALIEAEEYFDNLADCEIFTDTGYRPNKEMRMLGKVKEALEWLEELKKHAAVDGGQL